MQWIMLTVLQANSAAFGLYEKLGFSLDSTSPGVVEPTEDSGYEIMSKARRWARHCVSSRVHKHRSSTVSWPNLGGAVADTHVDMYGKLMPAHAC
jgi:hypothetical protein